MTRNTPKELLLLHSQILANTQGEIRAHLAAGQDVIYTHSLTNPGDESWKTRFNRESDERLVMAVNEKEIITRHHPQSDKKGHRQPLI